MYKTATDYASEENHPEIVELLAKHALEHIASVTAENQQLREEVALLLFECFYDDVHRSYFSYIHFVKY